ncbi:MAG: AarF/UbiB family protein, partial [Acidimicrobiia bacterium]
LKGLDTRSLVDELRSRMIEELDYRLEARNQQEFVDHYAGHPFVRIPAVVPELSTERVLTTEWVDGDDWATFVASADQHTRHRAGEIIWRFAQASIFRMGAFNGDPHPGNYRFHDDGTVTFLDFGLVKRWSPGEWERLAPSLDAIYERDPDRLVTAMEAVGFLEPGHGLDPAAVFDYVSAPYVPYLTEQFGFTRSFVADALGAIIDIKGPHAAIIEKLNMPPSFVILDRVVWGVSALLGKLALTRPWRAMLLEYRAGGPPATELGVADARWWAERGQSIDRAG